MNKKTIVYISGEGRSGSTLLDILLGNQKNAFSSGELIYFAEKGINNGEYCACGNPVPDCEIWSKIIAKWNKERILDLDEYVQLQKRLTSKKNILSSYFSLRNPSGEIIQFLEDTKKLYSAIFKITESEIIIDSSKAPLRLLFLKKLGYDVKVIHLIRRFGDVLNSYKKKAEKDLKAGVEHDITPLNTFYVFSSWLQKNLFTYIFTRDISYQKIKYDQLVLNPLKELSSVINENSTYTDQLRNRGPFYPEHLVAGNSIRMKNHIHIAEKPMNTSYHRLNKKDKMFAKLVDCFY